MKNYQFEVTKYLDTIEKILIEIKSVKVYDSKVFQFILRKYPKDKSGVFAKDQIIAGYRALVANGMMSEDAEIVDRIRLKPTRTMSGVTTVTVLTKPFPCPGKCIFCPNDFRMPKSYLENEPGAQRAERNLFDPYLQVYNRLLALYNTGHNTDKVELIILGGTWSFYPEEYKIWFVKRCFDALNDFGVVDLRSEVNTKNIFSAADRGISHKKKSYNQVISELVNSKGTEFISNNEKATWDELLEAQIKNESAKSRSVGLVIETRPDYITEKEVLNIRKLGATKVQIGIQSLSDEVLKLNKRGHTVSATQKAFRLLRLGGFKIHAHWMPGLYGSNVKNDIVDYHKLWKSDFCPDELKIYPVSIIQNTELNDLFKKGEFVPYTYEETLKVLSETMKDTPRYCRISRVIRDIPSADIVSGNKFSNFRQIAELNIEKQGKKCECIRCREIKGEKVTEKDLELERIDYQTSNTKEIFLSFKTKKSDNIAGFLRLSLPENHNEENFISELRGNAMIREVHVYGQVLGLGDRKQGRSQHLGLGTKLISKAKEIAKENGFKNIAVISAVGTREYYRKLGFKSIAHYQIV